MDLVERAGGLLEQATQPAPKPLPASAGACTADAVARAAERMESERARHSAQPERGPAEARGGVSRSVAIDLRWLRTQRLISTDGERTPMTESFRRVKRHIISNLANPGAGPRPNLIMITSSIPGEGKTFCAVNLAISLAMEIDRTVLLVDADVAKPAVGPTLGLKLENAPGLLDVLSDDSVALADVLYHTNLGKLTVLPAGRPNARATELLGGERADAFLGELSRRYEDRVVIFDSAPLLAASEACSLASHMGQIVVVVEAGRTTEKCLKDALSHVESCRLAGVLLNKWEPSRTQRSYGYGYRHPPSAERA